MEMRRALSGSGMPILSLASKAACFDAAQMRAICDAFDGAWASLQAAGSPFTNPAKALAAREVLAKRIIDMAQGGVLDVAELRDDALAHLRRAGE
jgi:hypothetical protein